MTDTLTALDPSPADFIDALERKCVRHATPCGDGQLVWRSFGEGYPLVLLHGGTGSWLHWVRNIEALARDFRLLVPDIPGSGESANPPAPISAESIAMILRGGIESILGADTRFAVAGFSMGGLIAGYLAAACARADALLLVGGTGMGPPRAEMEPLKSWRRLPSKAEQRDVHRANLGILMIHDPQKIDELAVHVQMRNAGQSRVRGKHVSHTGLLADCVPHFKGRVAGVWGEFDATAFPYLDDRREKLQRYSPGASFEVIPGAGHWVQYEAHEAVNRRLRAALT
jgi:pimeloyl-ACP methyl ester carboxylesterase